MVCPICGKHFKVAFVRTQLYLLHDLDYDEDIPGRWCYECSMDHVRAHSITIFEGSEYDIDDPEYHY